MTEKKDAIIDELRYLQQKLEKLEQLFNFADDEVETEALIYEEKAAMLRYSKAIRDAKDEGITMFMGKEK